jgi:predicted SAM-dependent methyltransferase
MRSIIAPLYRSIRTFIRRRRIKRLVANHSPCRIVVGASGIYEDGWIATDIDTLNILRLADWERYFAKSPIDAILAEHVWEHLPWEEGILAAQNCYNYLRDGCYIRVAVPDGFHPNPTYIEWVRPGGSGAGANDHKVLYTYQSLSQIFEKVGFHVELLEYFDEQGIFHYNEWNKDTGMIHRSKRFDRRNQDGVLNYTSIILDARK